MIKLGSTDEIIIQEWLVWTTVLAWSRSQSIFGLVNSLFHSHSLHWNVGGPIRLLCKSDVLHGNNGDQESWAIKAVCRRL